MDFAEFYKSIEDIKSDLNHVDWGPAQMIYLADAVQDLARHVEQIKEARCLYDEWKDQAEEAGRLEDYKYHLGMMEKPLPFRMWLMKIEALDRIQTREDYQEGRELPPGLEERATRLCKELGV